MTVYVDDMCARFGRMIMCHMIADTDAELHAMAAAIGVARRWHQAPPRHDSHYDIALSKRALAVSLGAVEVSWRDCSMMTFLRRRDPSASLITAAEGEAMLMAEFERRRRTSDEEPATAGRAQNT
jgi:hypothetical protein